MLPAPARMAAAPRPSSGPSWNPAVPPPPVAGAAVTGGLPDRRGGAAAAEVDAAEAVAPALGEMVLAVLLGEAPAVVVVAPEGDNEDGVAEGKDPEGRDPEHAETDRDASMATVAQPTTVRLAVRLVPVMIVRIFTDLLMPGQDGGYVFPVPVSEGNSRVAQEGPARAGRHKGKAHMRRRQVMAVSSLEYQAT
jgi:hypothetical protein